ncbi:MAG: hypothetical protein AMJ81_01990 [Phycisphaerae bacterium SM23_33]|nr:MAG: hypothetical protein AMJ81_01990 [Phycisphaerae bacterium SM23_33]
MDRPTFSESWYRVAELHPRLRSTVQVYRQHFRGQMWHVLQDPSNNQFSRLNEPAYGFVGMLDGRRTVGEVWRICNETLGDAAPTQGEAIQLLGQLYASNLLHAELPPDTESLFKRYQRRVQREVKSYLMNFLFIRIPLIDPDAFLNALLPAVRWIFTWVGFVLWAGLLVVGGYFAVTHFDALLSRGQDVFARANLMKNLPLMYLSIIVVKILHEFGHAFACKKFGQQAGSGGEVHVMGVMFLVFMPLPYVDASSAWAFRSKWHRVLVGTMGMMVELGIASVAAAVWALTGPGPVNAVAYNVIFIASVSTLLFNGNPLLRYDAYYILSDLLEIPNLAPRSRQYLSYLVRRHAWGVRRPQNPAHTTGEKGWMVFYGIASTLYRVFILTVIILFLGNRLPNELFVIAAVLGVVAAVVWLGAPVGKLVYYLATSGELDRVRPRAAASTVAAVAAILVPFAIIPTPDRSRIEGVVEPARHVFIHAAADGFVVDCMPSGRDVDPEGPPLLRAVNMELSARKDRWLAQHRGLEARRRLAETQDIAAAQYLDQQIAALDDQIRRVDDQLNALVIKSPFAGQWISPNIERLKGAYLRHGDRVGVVAGKDGVIIRATAPQQDAMLIEQAGPRVEIRLKGCPDGELTGSRLRILPAGKEHLPSPALSSLAGGPIVTAPEQQRGLVAVEPFFEIHIQPDPDPRVPLLTGQRVVVRFRMADKPLLAQLWRAVLQMFQERFHV